VARFLGAISSHFRTVHSLKCSRKLLFLLNFGVCQFTTEHLSEIFFFVNIFLVRRYDVRVVFMGTPQAAVPSLERLVTDGYKVAGVYTQPDRTAGRGRSLAFSPVKQAAMQWGLRVLQPENFREGEDIKKLADLKPEVIVICAYGQILPQSVLDIPPYQCINIHFSLLPRHRGASPVAAAILAGAA